MNLLVCCEESQAVCKAFLEYGVNAFSCDLQPCSGGRPDRHIVGDCLNLIYPNINVGFHTDDGIYHYVWCWDMIICHPPCTFISNAGNRSLYDREGNIVQERYMKGCEAVDFFLMLYNAPVDKIVVENPRPSSIFEKMLPQRSQIVSPDRFGSDYMKRTYLWEKGVPPLIEQCRTLNPVPAQHADWYMSYSHGQRQKNRSKTDPMLAAAMAHQWH